MSLYDFYRPMQFHPSNRVHPSAVLHKNVQMGEGNTIGPGCILGENVTLGNNNMLVGYACIGLAPEHKDPKFHPSNAPVGPVLIGSDNIIREFVTINAPIHKEGTRVGSRCYIMRGGHVGHDAWVEDDVIMSCNVVLGGHTLVMQGAYMGIHSAAHPKVIVGAYAMLGMGAMALEHVPVGVKAVGVPLRILGPNTIGLERAKVTPEQRAKLNAQFDELKKVGR